MELDYILQHFDERFHRFKGRRVALYPGRYLDEIVRRFHSSYRFCRVLASGASEAPKDVELVILTDCRENIKSSFDAIRESCKRQGTTLTDPFGVDLLKTRRELTEQKHLALSQWKELLINYDVVSLAVPFVVADYVKPKDRWILRRKFLILYDWLKKQGKTIHFLWENEKQTDPLIAEGIEVSGDSFEEKEDESCFLRLIKKYPGRKIVHIGREVERDGLAPRDYGVDSRLWRYFVFQFKVSPVNKVAEFYADRNRLIEAIDRHDVVVFNVFDTLLKRIVSPPSDVFETTEERTGVEGFAENRRRLEALAPSLSLEESYARLKENCGYDDQALETLRRTELEIESELVFPRESMTEILEYAKSRKKKIVLVDDMRLGPIFTDELLRKNGIEGYQTLVPLARDATFDSETVFDAASSWSAQTETILWVGNDSLQKEIVDIRRDVAFFYVPSCLEAAKKNGYADLFETPLSLTERKILGLGAALAFDDPFEPNDDLRIACMIIAPLAVAYLLWVVGELKGKGYDYFLFSSRDGWILQDVYERLRREAPTQAPPSKYFYLNRRSAILTIMDNFDLLKYYFYLPFQDDPPRLLRQIFGLPDDKLLPYHGEPYKEYYGLHQETIRKAAEQYRANYRSYLRKEGVDGKKCAIMDFVSEGNAQSILEENIVKMDGFYVGLPNHVTKYNKNIRYFFDHDLTTYDTLMRLEVYFTSPEPALEYIGDDGAPVFAKETRDQKTMERLRKIHGYARRYFDAFFERLHVSGLVGEAANKETFFDLCAKINQYDVENFYYDDMKKIKMTE